MRSRRRRVPRLTAAASTSRPDRRPRALAPDSRALLTRLAPHSLKVLLLLLLAAAQGDRHELQGRGDGDRYRGDGDRYRVG